MRLSGELADGFVGVVDRPIDAVAEAELLSQADRNVTEYIGVSARTNAIHQPRVVLGVDQRLDLSLEAEALPEVGLFHGASGMPTRNGGGEGLPHLQENAETARDQEERSNVVEYVMLSCHNVMLCLRRESVQPRLGALLHHAGPTGGFR